MSQPLRRRRLPHALLLGALPWLALGACTGQDGAAPGPGDLDTPPVDGATVTIDRRAYEPSEVEVVAGEAVVFTNEDDEDHTVTATDLLFDSGAQQPGETFRFLTDDSTPATVSFRCELHPEMEGRLRVGPAEG